MRLSFVIFAAACGSTASPPNAAPQNRAAPAGRLLPDDACLQLGVERYPADLPRSGAGNCLLRGEEHPPTGRWCIKALRDLGGEDLELTGCYRQQGTSFALDHAAIVKSEAEEVFMFDGNQCWILGNDTWASIAQPVKAFTMKTTGCTKTRSDWEF